MKLLITGLILCFNGIFPVPIHKIGQKSYISLGDFMKIRSDLTNIADPLSLSVEIHFKKEMVRLRVGHSFYIRNGKQYTLEYPPVLKGSTLYIPSELAEELFTELKIPVKYRFRKVDLQVEKSDDEEKALPGKLPEFIILDAGHGGHDPGAKGKSGSIEKDITLKTIKYVAAFIRKKYPGVKVFLTRSGDRFVSLDHRADFANQKSLIFKKGRGIFISLHCNSTLSTKSNGYEIYYLAQNSGNEEARRVMLRENGGLSGSKNIRVLESYLVSAQIQSRSKSLARAFNRAFLTSLRSLVMGRGVKKADFAVLRGSLMPAVLIEMGYISNIEEAGVLKSAVFRKKLAAGIVKGLIDFNERENKR